MSANSIISETDLQLFKNLSNPKKVDFKQSTNHGNYNQVEIPRTTIDGEIESYAGEPSSSSVRVNKIYDSSDRDRGSRDYPSRREYEYDDERESRDKKYSSRSDRYHRSESSRGRDEEPIYKYYHSGSSGGGRGGSGGGSGGGSDTEVENESPEYYSSSRRRHYYREDDDEDRYQRHSSRSDDRHGDSDGNYHSSSSQRRNPFKSRDNGHVPAFYESSKRSSNEYYPSTEDRNPSSSSRQEASIFDRETQKYLSDDRHEYSSSKLPRDNTPVSLPRSVNYNNVVNNSSSSSSSRHDRDYESERDYSRYKSHADSGSGSGSRSESGSGSRSESGSGSRSESGSGSRSESGSGSSSKSHSRGRDDDDEEEKNDYTRQEKTRYLLQLDKLRLKGARLTREYNINDSLAEIRFECDTHQSNRDVIEMVDMMKAGLKICFYGLEFVNFKIGPILKIQGWADHMSADIEKFDRVLERIYHRYWRQGQASLSMEFLTLIVGSLITFHIKNICGGVDVVNGISGLTSMFGVGNSRSANHAPNNNNTNNNNNNNNNGGGFSIGNFIRTFMGGGGGGNSGGSGSGNNNHHSQPQNQVRIPSNPPPSGNIPDHRLHSASPHSISNTYRPVNNQNPPSVTSSSSDYKNRIPNRTQNNYDIVPPYNPSLPPSSSSSPSPSRTISSPLTSPSPSSSQFFNNNPITSSTGTPRETGTYFNPNLPTNPSSISNSNNNPNLNHRPLPITPNPLPPSDIVASLPIMNIKGINNSNPVSTDQRGPNSGSGRKLMRRPSTQHMGTMLSPIREVDETNIPAPP